MHRSTDHRARAGGESARAGSESDGAGSEADGTDVVTRARRIAAAALSQARSAGSRDWDRPGSPLDEADTPTLRGAVTTVLASELRQVVTQAWRRGWQPADLDRSARRGGASTAVLTELIGGIAAELATYPRSTVEPRWWQQVEDLRETAAAGRTGMPSVSGGGVQAWRASCLATVEAVVLVERLPRLTVIGALPGERQHRGDGASTVDDKLLTKVRRLLAQAEGTPYEAEAETFTAAAQSLMARHRIDRAMLDASDPERPDRAPDAVRIAVDRPYEGPKVQLLHQIGAANRCRVVWTQFAGFATVVGFEADRRAVELLFTSLLVQATAAMQREGERGEATRSRGFRSSFLLGFATRIGQRLEESATAEEAAALTRLGAGTDPTSLAGTSAQASGDQLGLVLRGRDENVRARTREIFPHLRSGRARQVSDYGGFVTGRAAADQASLGVSGRLGGRAS